MVITYCEYNNMILAYIPPKYSKKWHDATVSWFNDGSGEGVVRTLEGRDFYCHYSAIEGNNKITDNYKERKALKPKQKVKIQVLDDKFSRHVTKLKIIKGV